MKGILTTILALGLFGTMCWMPTAYAKPDTDSAAEDAADEELAKIPAALVGRDIINGAKLNTKAKVYFLYKSRSTCSICVSVCPAIVATYKKMKGKAELVMLNTDETREDAVKWIRKSHVKYPVIAPADVKGVPFPFSGGSTMPRMVAVDADGNELGSASGEEVPSFLANNWKKFVSEQEKAAKKASKAAAKNSKKSTDSTGDDE